MPPDRVKALVFPGGSEPARVSMVRDDLGAFQAIVGGDIEGAPAPAAFDNVQPLINAEGKFLALPNNEAATKFLAGTLMRGDYIAGPMIVTCIGPDGKTADVTDELIEVVIG